MRAAVQQNPEPKKPFFDNARKKRKAINPRADFARRNVRRLPTRQMNRGR